MILESTSPGIKEEANQLERRLVDDARAKVLDIAGIELFVNDWEKLPLFQSQQGLPVEIQLQITTIVSIAKENGQSIKRLWYRSNAKLMAAPERN